MDYAAARARALAAEQSLDLTEPVTLCSTHRHLERLRDRKIVIRPMDGPTDKVCGLWFGLDHMDLILHAQAASEVHRQQIVLHEFAHMILRHEQVAVAPDYVRNFFTDLVTDRVIKALKRSDFLDEFEVTAELLADLLAARIRNSQRRTAGQPGNFGSIFG
jgi:Zn-dependent peptidase ImmA (M78 family)